MYQSIHTQLFRALTLTTVFLVGCGYPAPSDENASTTSDNGTSFPLQVLSDRPELPPTSGQYSETEPNDTLEQANILNNTGYTDLNGSIQAGSDPLDTDIYRLNGGDAGTHVQASLTILSGYDLVLGLLDDQQRLLAYADPASSVNGPRVIDLVLREATTELIIVVAARSSSGTSRPYTVRMDVLEPAAIPAYQPQVIVLNFDGAASVKIGRRSPVYVPPFDASALGSNYIGLTNTIVNLVVDRVRDDYAGLGVDVYASGDPSIPADSVTTIHFGTYDASLLGLADSIDPYNTLTEQNAIVYTDTFSLFNVLKPSVEQMGQVLANVASHEAGHLLGLRHTEDMFDLMDITASARQMLSDQWFRNADIHPSVLPTGYQDSPALLEWTLGGMLIAPSTGKVTQLQRHIATIDDPDDFYIPRHLLSSCATHEHEIDDSQTDAGTGPN